MTEIKQLNWAKDDFENIEEAWKGDLWDRRRLGEQLTNYVDRLQCGAVLALDARWGEGKTWFVRHWKKHLENENHNVIYLDAFANDYLDDPFLVISSEITSCLSKDEDVNQSQINIFKEKAAAAYHALLPSLPKVLITLGLNLISGGILGTVAQQIHESGEKVIESATDELGDKIKESIETKIENHEADKNTLLAFKQELAQLAEELDKPLVFIIDELDRCRPDFAIRLIERIKHFFDIPKIVFLLVMDKTQFSKIVCHNYGYDEKLGETYLDKFLDFSIKLKSTLNEPNFHKNAVRSLFSNILGYDQETVDTNNFYHECCAYVQATNFSKRTIKTLVHKFSLLKTNNSEMDSLILATLFFYDQSDLYQSVFNAISNYTRALTFTLEELKNQDFSQVWYPNNNFNLSRAIESIWTQNLNISASILIFINKIQSEIKNDNSFINVLYGEETRIFKILKDYSINNIYQSNQFDMGWKKYIESGILI